jgi:protease I
MAASLKGKKVAILVTDGFEQVELTSPKEALEKAGATAVIVSPKSGVVQGWNHYEKGDTFKVDVPLDHAKASQFDALLLPGGVANPDQLRVDASVLVFVRQFFSEHKPVAAICHGPWTLIDAGVVDGRRMTSYKSVRMDLVNAGAIWENSEVVVDNGLVTSRDPDDLPAFNRKLVEEVGEGIHERQHV